MSIRFLTLIILPVALFASDPPDSLENADSDSLPAVSASDKGSCALDAGRLKSMVGKLCAEVPSLVSDSLSEIIRYNRAEGLYLGLDYDSRRTGDKYKGIFLKLGYAISARTPQYTLGAALRARPFNIPSDFIFAFGRRAETNDIGLVPQWENSLQMLLFGRDLCDWYQNAFSGITGTVRLKKLSLTGSLGNDTYRSMQRRETFYLFGSDSNGVVRHNPGVREARDHYLKCAARWKCADSVFPRKGTDLRVAGEYSGGFIKSDFTYRKAEADMRLYRTTSGNAEIAVRIFAGEVTSKTADYDIATQKLFDFGGVGTVRGFSHRQDPSLLDKSRICFVNIEHTRLVFPGAAFRPFMRSFKKGLLFSLFADAGNAWNPQDYKRDNLGFDPMLQDLELSAIHKTLGMGFSTVNRFLRFDYMRLWRHDRANDDGPEDRISLRLNSPL